MNMADIGLLVLVYIYVIAIFVFFREVFKRPAVFFPPFCPYYGGKLYFRNAVFQRPLCYGVVFNTSNYNSRIFID